MKRRTEGFSLIELIIAMAVAGILAVIASPSIKSWIQGAEYREAAWNLSSALRDARSKAISYNREHQVVIQPGGGAFELYRGDRSYNTPSAGSDWTQLSATQNLSQDVTLKYDYGTAGACDQTSDVSIHFYPNGSASPSPIPELCILDGAGTVRYRVQISTTTGKVLTTTD